MRWDGASTPVLFSGPYAYCSPQKAQKQRIVGVGRDLWRSSSPTPLLKQGHLQQAAQDRI